MSTGRRRSVTSDASRGGAVYGLAGVGRSGAEVHGLGCGLVQNDGRDTCGPLGSRARVGGGRWEREEIGLRGVGLGLLLGLGFVGFSSSFSLFLITPSFLFLIQTKFEFKYKFEFKPHSNN